MDMTDFIQKHDFVLKNEIKFESRFKKKNPFWKYLSGNKIPGNIKNWQQYWFIIDDFNNGQRAYQ